MPSSDCVQNQYNDSYLTWSTNIQGLEKESIRNFLYEDLSNILGPVSYVLNNDFLEDHKLQNLKGRAFPAHLQTIIDQRRVDLGQFLGRVRNALDEKYQDSSSCEPIAFTTLAGDSHQGGARPLLLYLKPEPKVLKYADPRPYLFLARILKELSCDIDVSLEMPNIDADPENQWYLVPFIESSQGQKTEPERFMYSIAALTSVAYALRMVDLHMENILVHEGRPIIIDPECIFSNFSPMSENERLLSTGLLSHNPVLSALRGGGPNNGNIFQIGLEKNKDGSLGYRMPAPSFQNRICDQIGQPLDPANFRNEFIAGYVDALNWLRENRNAIADIIETFVTDDFRIRYLVRKTRLYTVTNHMLNLPVGEYFAEWRESVFQRFNQSSHFPDAVSDKLIQAEIHDMDHRDIPFFWTFAGDQWIRHSTGAVQKLDSFHSPKRQAVLDIQSLNTTNIDDHVKILDEFLNQDLLAA